MGFFLFHMGDFAVFAEFFCGVMVLIKISQGAVLGEAFVKSSV
jgi:hypothetical protein